MANRSYRETRDEVRRYARQALGPMTVAYAAEQSKDAMLRWFQERHSHDTLGVDGEWNWRFMVRAWRAQYREYRACTSPETWQAERWMDSQ